MTQANEDTQKALEILDQLQEQISQTDEIDMVSKAQAVNCVHMIRNRLTHDKAAEKEPLDTLVKSVDKSSHLTDLVVQLSDLIGYMPSA